MQSYGCDQTGARLHSSLVIGKTKRVALMKTRSSVPFILVVVNMFITYAVV